MPLGQGRKKPYSERSLTSSRVRTGKKGRKSPRKKPVRTLSMVGATARTKPTTGYWTPPDLEEE